MHTTHFVTNDPISKDRLDTGLQTAYHDTGSGQAFVLVHGFTGSKLDFHDQLNCFAHDHRVLAYDQRGHGESSNTGPYNLYGLAADLIGFLDAVDIERCHVLGHSLGGMVVLRALLVRPERFASAVLMDTAPYGMKIWKPKDRKRLHDMVLAGGCTALLEGMRGQPQPAAVQRGIDFLGEQEHWRRIRVKLEQMDPQAFVDLTLELDEQPSVLASLGRIEMPVTVVVGAEDAPFVKPSRDMHKALPNSELAIIENAGHSAQYENAERWRAVIENHLARVS